MMEFIEGTIIEGDKKASALGFPTINIAYRAGELPEIGIYAGGLIYDGEEYPGAICLAPDKKIEIHCFETVPIKHLTEASLVFRAKISEYVSGDDDAMKKKIADDVKKTKQFFVASKEKIE